MILLDTNVISELMRPVPQAAVSEWLDDKVRGEVGTTAITVAEVLYGIISLAEGRRRRLLLEAAADVFEEYLAERVFAFDHRAAVRYAEVVRRREGVGTPISMADAQIAAICLGQNAVLATRNTKDFENTGLDLIDPWTPE